MCAKKIIYFGISISVLLCCAILTVRSVTRTNLSDRATESLTTELHTVREQLSQSNAALRSIGNKLESVTSEFGRSNKNLGDVIESLERIRDKVKEMEDIVYNSSAY